MDAALQSLVEELERPQVGVIVGNNALLIEVRADGAVKLLGLTTRGRDISEAFTDADKEAIARVVRTELKDGKSRDTVERLIKNALVKLYKALYTRRNFWKAEVDVNPE